MVNTRRIGRLGMLAIGLGIGSAVAAAPGMAWADSSDSPGDALTVGGAAAAGSAATVTDATTVPGLFDFDNFAVSIDGFTLVHNGTATATSSLGDIAIADGAGATATADNGFLEIATAGGSDADASASGGFLNIANALGDKASATTQYGSVDLASAYGDSSTDLAGGDYNSSTSAVNPGYVDWASSLGASSTATAGDTTDGIKSSVDLANAYGDGISALAQNGPFDINLGDVTAAGAGLPDLFTLF